LWTVCPWFPRLRRLIKTVERYVGKGDRRTRRGKIYAGSFGKSRPKDPSKGKVKAKAPAKAATPAAKPATRTATRKTTAK